MKVRCGVVSGQCIAIVSGKGGTGKTSLTAGVGTALAQSGKRVLCVDCDIGLRNLDLALGLTDRALMDFSDVALDRCPLEAAVVAHPSIPNLYLLTAPVRMRWPAVTEEDFRRMLQKIRQQFDFCLLDAPAGLGLGFRLIKNGFITFIKLLSHSPMPVKLSKTLYTITIATIRVNQ